MLDERSESVDIGEIAASADVAEGFRQIQLDFERHFPTRGRTDDEGPELHSSSRIEDVRQMEASAGKCLARVEVMGS